MDLVNDTELARSDVVANRAMNRTRRLTGRDGYQAVLGFDIVGHRPRRWLDLCCGSGLALFEAADRVPAITGVDLVDFFAGPVPANVSLVVAPVGEWTPPVRFDLITCVHGLHYIGDKLGLLARASRWLAPGGVFVANLDARSIQPFGAKILQQPHVRYDGRRNRITITGPACFDARYLGADKDAGPNHTGQPAVRSYYSVQG